MAETTTLITMPHGARLSAPIVSSLIWAEASKPVSCIAPGGNRGGSHTSRGSRLVVNPVMEGGAERMDRRLDRQEADEQRHHHDMPPNAHVVEQGHQPHAENFITACRARQP